METVDDYATARLLANGYLSVTPLKGLTLKTSLATDMTWERRKYFKPGSVDAEGIASGTSSYYNDYTWISETNATYAIRSETTQVGSPVRILGTEILQGEQQCVGEPFQQRRHSLPEQCYEYHFGHEQHYRICLAFAAGACEL